MGIKEYYGFFYSSCLRLPLYHTAYSLWLEIEWMVATAAEAWEVCFWVSTSVDFSVGRRGIDLVFRASSEYSILGSKFHFPGDVPLGPGNLSH